MLKEMSRRVRRNHALEHACVTLMLDSDCKPPLGGYSVPGGFIIIGGVKTDALHGIVGEALARLNAGQRELAISRHCGTNLAVGGIISGALTKLVWRRSSGWKRIPLTIAAIVAGTLLSRPIGNAIQRRYTTLADVQDLEIVSITKLWHGDSPRLHYVATRMAHRSQERLDAPVP